MISTLWSRSAKNGDEALPGMYASVNELGIESHPFPLRYNWLKRRQRRARVGLRKIAKLNWLQRKPYTVKHQQLENDDRDDDFSIDCDNSSFEFTYASSIFPHEVSERKTDSTSVAPTENTTESKSINSSLAYSFDSTMSLSVATASTNAGLDHCRKSCESKYTTKDSSLDYSIKSLESACPSVESAYSGSSWFESTESHECSAAKTLEFSKESVDFKAMSQSFVPFELVNQQMVVDAHGEHAYLLSFLENRGLWNLDEQLMTDQTPEPISQNEESHPSLEGCRDFSEINAEKTRDSTLSEYSDISPRSPRTSPVEVSCTFEQYHNHESLQEGSSYISYIPTGSDGTHSSHCEGARDLFCTTRERCATSSNWGHGMERVSGNWERPTSYTRWARIQRIRGQHSRLTVKD